MNKTATIWFETATINFAIAVCAFVALALVGTDDVSRIIICVLAVLGMLTMFVVAGITSDRMSSDDNR